MKTLRIGFWLALLAVGLLVCASARGQIVFGNPVDTAKVESDRSSGVLSSNNWSFDTRVIGAGTAPSASGGLVWTSWVANTWTLITNCPATWSEFNYRLWFSYNNQDWNHLNDTGYPYPWTLTNSEGKYPLVERWQPIGTTYGGIYLTNSVPIWFALECVIKEGVTVVADLWVGTNVIGQTEVVPHGVLSQQQFGMSLNGNTVPTGSAGDASGNLYVCGYWAGQATFGAVVTNTPLLNYTCGFLVKYNSAGTLQWFKSFVGTNFSNTGNTACKAVEVDSSGNVVVVGNFQNSVDFGAGAVAASSAIDAFCAKYDPAGGLGWVQHYGNNTTFDVGKTVAIDSTNGIYIVQDAVVGANIGFSLKKLSTTLGATVWTTNHAGSYWSLAKGIAVDTNNCPVICGSVQGPSIDLGGGPLTASGSYNIMLAKYSATDGAYQWGKLMGTAGGNHGYAVTTDTNRNVILTGLVQSANLGGGTVGSSGSIYLVGYDPNGVWLWNLITGFQNDSGAALVVKGNNLAAAGRSTCGIYFPGMDKMLLGNGQVNFWATSFTLSGTNAPTYVWARLTGAGLDGAANANAVCFDSAGLICPVGTFMATENFGLGNVTATGAGYSSGFILRYGN